MKKLSWIAGGVVAVLVALVLTGCPEPTGGSGGGTETDAELADSLIDEGLEHITDPQNRDWDAAFSSFAQAYDADPSNPSAALWYAFLNLAGVATADASQTFLEDFIGLQTYPQELNDVLDPSETGSWLSQTIVPNPEFPDTTRSVPFVPMSDDIKGFEDSTAIVTSQEYILGLANAVVSNNVSGFNAARTALANLLQQRLSEVLTVLNAVPDGASIALTYDMFYGSTTDATNGGWPQTTGGTPASVVIGAAEAKVLAAYLYSLDSFLYRTRALDVTFPVQEFWNVLNPINGSGDRTALPNPLTSGFLSEAGGASGNLDSAERSAATALELAGEAVAEILSDRPGFAYSSTSPVSEVASNWNSVENALQYQSIAIARLSSSIESGAIAVVPVDGSSYVTPDEFFAAYDTAAEWPTAVSYDGDGTPLAAAVNLQAVFDVPLLAASNIVELDIDGDPVLYEFTAAYGTPGTLARATGQPTALTAAHGGTAATPSNPDGTTNNTSLYAFRLPDITFGGAFPMDTTTVSQLRDSLTASGPFPMVGDAGDLVVQEGAAVSVYFPVFPPHVAHGAVADAGVEMTIDSSEYPYWMSAGLDSDTEAQTFTTRGSLFTTVVAAQQEELETWVSLKGADGGDFVGTEALTVVDGGPIASTGGGAPYLHYVFIVEPTQESTGNTVVLGGISLDGAATGGKISVDVHVVPEGSVGDWELRNDGSYDVGRTWFNGGTDPSGFSSRTTGFGVTPSDVIVIDIENNLTDVNGDPVDASGITVLVAPEPDVPN